jgi:Bacteriophage replication gene A protein (GPA)
MQRIEPTPMLPGETLGQYRKLDALERSRRQQAAFTERFKLPTSWVGRLLSRWGERYSADPFAASQEHLKSCTALAAVQKTGLAPDANDGDICDLAMQCAREVARRVGEAALHAPDGERDALMRAAASCFVTAHGVELPETKHRPLRTVLARVSCDRWWRRALRKLHAHAVEGTARGIGLVSVSAGCYASDDAVKRRRAQVARNARALQSVEAINEHGQAYTLAELAAKGTANQEIRRHELMTRIAGFDLIASDVGDDAMLATVTCPSRMHRKRIARGGDGGAQDNPRFDGTSPREAQQHLSQQWAKYRAAADRAGLGQYGFRIAEPNHDGTPHWHVLIFFPRVAGCGRPGYRVAVRLLRRYFLWQADPEERGARAHRVRVTSIDRTKGSAAGYVAKYIAKNIDGFKVEQDLYGNDAITSSLRVEAWATTWRIRQFQQIGGSPVTIWRELRRVHPDQQGASPPMAMALEAVNITASAKKIDDAHDLAQRETAANGWATYTMLQGGPRVPRALLRYRLLREQTGEVGRYGDVLPAKPIGVECAGGMRSEPYLLIGWGLPKEGKLTRTTPRRVLVEVESERCSWVIVQAPRGDDATKEQARERLRFALARGEAARPWSPVNNCTPQRLTGWAAIHAPPVDRHRKRGRWRDYTRKKAAPT